VRRVVEPTLGKTFRAKFISQKKGGFFGEWLSCTRGALFAFSGELGGGGNWGQLPRVLKQRLSFSKKIPHPNPDVWMRWALKTSGRAPCPNPGGARKKKRFFSPVFDLPGFRTRARSPPTPHTGPYCGGGTTGQLNVRSAMFWKKTQKKNHILDNKKPFLYTTL